MAHHRAKAPARAAAALCLCLGVAALPGPARAQFFGGWGGWDSGGDFDGLPPQQVRRAIAQRGFRVLAPLRRNGRVYVADVIDEGGQRERLIVAAADAQILQRFIVDDGRGGAPRAPEEGRSVAVRGGDEGLVPPADIPDAGRRFPRPADREVPAPRFGDLGPGDDGDAPAAPLRRAPPRTVKPRPRVVERTPEPPTGGREPGAVESTPLAPAPPKPVAAAPVPAPAAKAPAPPPAAVASRPEPAAVPVQAAPAAPASHRMTDPLAIPPGGDAKPVRNVAAGITGTPAPAPTAAVPAKRGDVPVAPLD